jgi:hypothetical protein
MDVAYFLKKRTTFIRNHYDGCVCTFETVKKQIEDETPPFDNPPYSEDPEPAYLEEWMEADASINIAGLSCVSLLADTLKLYLRSIQQHELHFEFDEKEARKVQRNFVKAYQEAIGEILDTDWSESGVDFAVIEQVVLARNRGQHGSELTMLSVVHDAHTLRKHPRPFFADETEWRDWEKQGGPVDSFLNPAIHISRGKLFAAIAEVEKLAEWIEENRDRAREWRERQRNAETADISGK